jgi:hypothetical protein
MFRAVSGLVVALLTFLVFASSAEAAQALSVEVGDTGPQVSHLVAYVPGAPIEVRVKAPGARSAALVGLGPDGSNVRFPLDRAADGTFTGNAALGAPGTWSLAVATTSDGPEILGESFPVVVAPGPSKLEIAALIAMAVVSIGGGVGLIAAGRSGAAARASA